MMFRLFKLQLLMSLFVLWNFVLNDAADAALGSMKEEDTKSADSEEEFYYHDIYSPDDVKEDDAATDMPSMTPTFHETSSPSHCPTGTKSPVTPPPTYRSHPTSTPSYAPTRYPTEAPTIHPTVSPSPRPSPAPITPAPSNEPTVNKALADLKYPKYFSSSADSVLLALGGIVCIAWAAIGGLYAYRRLGWSVGKFGEDRQNLVGTKAPKRKRIKKFEDYWDEESEDNTARKFPTRAAASASTFEDYWDESVDFSSHSSDALNFSRSM